MKVLTPILILGVPLAVHFLLAWVRKTDTSIGRRIRASDQDAAQYAIEKREGEIREIREWMHKNSGGS